jgi:hypothetical protein
MIDEATPSIHPQPSAVIATARQAALKAVKAELRAQGRKPNSFTLPELRHQANDYFAERRAELIAQTWEWVRSSPSLRELYDREQHDRQRKLERNSKHLHSAKSAVAQGVSLCESRTQNTHSGSER